MTPLSDILQDHVDKLFDDLPHDPKDESSTPPTSSEPLIPGKGISSDQVNQLRQIVHGLQDQLDAVLRILANEPAGIAPLPSSLPTPAAAQTLATGERVLEGVFNGQKMIGSDGHEYPVPPNYASKSKLVEGDIMKLTITSTGAFIYKQIGPIARKRVVGQLLHDSVSGQWSVAFEGKNYKILTASATFYKGNPGDEVVFLLPQEGTAEWGAVENIIHK